MVKKIYNIYYHSKQNKVGGIKQIPAYTLLQAKFLFSKDYNMYREFVIDDVKVRR